MSDPVPLIPVEAIRREILVPVSSRELEQDPTGTLGPARFTAESYASENGWTIPPGVDPTVVGTYHEAADLSAWTRRMIDEALAQGDDLADLAFVYWTWEDAPDE